MSRLIVLSILPLLVAASSFGQSSLRDSLSGEGKFEVATKLYEFHDSARDRDVPLKIYYPAGANGPLPTIIFSHGLGGSREGYSYLGKFWASHGFVSVHVQHIGSDSALLKTGPLRASAEMTKAMLSPENAVNRPKDISFTIDKLKEMNESDPLFKGMLDLARLGVAGHSFGAYTTLAVAGQSFPNGKNFHDSRVKAAIEMSAPGKTLSGGTFEGQYSSISIPMFHMTGTEDEMPMNKNPENRKVPYQSIKAQHQYIIVFDGGDHMVFSGRVFFKKRDNDELFHQIICRASTAFWMAYLSDDKEAADYLDLPDGLKKDVGAAGLYDHK